MDEEESFIVLENTPSLMEPYSFLEMPDSVSLQSGGNSAAAAGAAAPPLPPQTTKNDPATANGTETNIDENALLRSIWSTQALTGSTNTVVTTANTQTYTSSLTKDTLIWLSAERESEPVSINKPYMDTYMVQRPTDSISLIENKEIEANANGGQHPEKEATPFSSVGSSDASTLKSTKETSMEANAGKLSMTNSLSTTPKDKLAESFLLGNIDFDTMKSTVQSHFPSLITSTSTATTVGNQQQAECTPNAVEHIAAEIEGGQPWNDASLEMIELPVVKGCHNMVEELTRQNAETQQKIAELQQILDRSGNLPEIGQNKEVTNSDSMAVQSANDMPNASPYSSQFFDELKKLPTISAGDPMEQKIKQIALARKYSEIYNSDSVAAEIKNRLELWNQFLDKSGGLHNIDANDSLETKIKKQLNTEALQKQFWDELGELVEHIVDEDKIICSAIYTEFLYQYAMKVPTNDINEEVTNSELIPVEMIKQCVKKMPNAHPNQIWKQFLEELGGLPTIDANNSIEAKIENAKKIFAMQVELSKQFLNNGGSYKFNGERLTYNYNNVALLVKFIEHIYKMKNNNGEPGLMIHSKFGNFTILVPFIKPIDVIQNGATHRATYANEQATKSDAMVAEIKEQYEEKIHTMQFELSKAIGENMEFEDMKKTYVDEIDCLKVNLVATEELYKENVAQTNILKSRNAFLSQEITDNRKQISALQTDNDLLKAQLDQYKKDFEIEQTARQELSNEREQILSDLQQVQARNRELLEAADNSFSSAESQPTTESGEARAITQYSCPMCAAQFVNFQLLEIHVDQCLDRLEQSSH